MAIRRFSKGLIIVKILPLADGEADVAPVGIQPVLPQILTGVFLRGGMKAQRRVGRGPHGGLCDPHLVELVQGDAVPDGDQLGAVVQDQPGQPPV